MGEQDRSFWAPLEWPARAVLVLLGHLGAAAMLLTGIWAVERYTKWLYGEDVQLLFGLIPLSWAFDAADFGVLALFVFWGLVEANRQLKRR
jgi:hypothetical protein